MVMSRTYVPPSERKEQTYHCRNEMCKKEVVSVGIPVGWYFVRKCVVENGQLMTVAMTCSLLCLVLDATSALYDQLAKGRY